MVTVNHKVDLARLPESKFGTGAGGLAAKELAAAASVAVKDAVSVAAEKTIPYLHTAEALDQKAMKRLIDWWEKVAGKKGMGNLSPEDWASRLNTLLAIYIPQSAISFWENKHKWETLGRNILVWSLTFAVLVFNKNATTSINSLLFNRLMQPRQSDVTGNFLIRPLKRAWNALKFPGDYLEVVKAVGLKASEKDRGTAFWTTFDNLFFKKMNNVLKPELETKVAAGIATESEKEILRMIKPLSRRVMSFNLMSVGIILALLAWLVGKASMEIVFRFIAPWDHDFDPSKYPGAKKPVSKVNGATSTTDSPPRLASLMEPPPVKSTSSVGSGKMSDADFEKLMAQILGGETPENPNAMHRPPGTPDPRLGYPQPWPAPAPNAAAPNMPSQAAMPPIASTPWPPAPYQPTYPNTPITPAGYSVPTPPLPYYPATENPTATLLQPLPPIQPPAPAPYYGNAYNTSSYGWQKPLPRGGAA